MHHAVRRSLAAVSLLLALPLSITPAAATTPTFVEGVVLVGFKPDVPESARAEARLAAGASAASRLTSLDPTAEKLSLRPGLSVPQAIKALLRNPNIRYAEPDYVVTHAALSNDTYYTNGNLWGLYGDASTPSNSFGSQAAEAWAAGFTGSRNIHVGIVDEGIQVTHPDLVANIWVNPFDPLDGTDNDGNGFANDVNGWDFVNNDASVYDGSSSKPSVDAHGTHVAGTIGGVGGNGAGVAGVNWQVSIISAKFLGANGGSTSDAVRAVDYLNDLKSRHGINIVATNNSWGGGGFSQAMLDAINRGGDRGILFIAAAGNASTNNDTTPSYPASYQCTTTAAGQPRGWDCIVSVAAITSTGGLASYSNYGSTSVDLGAPGSAIVSSVPVDSYASYNGTSMATPHVTGAAALCASINPALTAQEIRAAILNSVAPTNSLAGKTVTGGRLDIGAMATLCQPPSAPVSGAPGGLAASAVSASSIALTWLDGVSNESYYEVQRGDASCAGFVTVAKLTANATTYTDTGLTGQTGYCYRVRAGNLLPSVSTWSGTAQAQTMAPPPPYTCSPVPYQWLSPALNAVALGDDAQFTAALPFGFPFYGNSATSVSVGSNGFLRLDSGAATSYANAAIASTAEPNGFIAAYWDDLDPSSGGAVGTGTLGTPGSRQFVVTWDNVPHFSLAGSALSFQVVLEEATGDFVLNYRDVVVGSSTYDYGRSATVGVENPQGTAGTAISVNAATLADLTSYRCTTRNVASVPAAPALKVASVAANAVGLSWPDVMGETGYVVERSPDGATAWGVIANLSANATSYADSGLQPTTAYYYRIRAMNDLGASAYSAVVSATTLAVAPSAPTSLSAAALSSSSVALAWADNSGNETGFEVERSLSGGTFAKVATLGSNATSFTDSGLAAATSYTYRVRAVSGSSGSAYSNTASATTPAPTVLSPAAPANVSVKLASGRKDVAVSWSDQSSNETAFEVGRALASAPASIVVVGTVAANTVRYTDTPGIATSYVYFVRATNGGGNSAWAGPSTVVTTR